MVKLDAGAYRSISTQASLIAFLDSVETLHSSFIGWGIGSGPLSASVPLASPSLSVVVSFSPDPDESSCFIFPKKLSIKLRTAIPSAGECS